MARSLPQQRFSESPPNEWPEMERHRERLVRFVQMRLDRRVRGRIDASDVVQDALHEAVQRLPDYERDPAVPFYVWLRFLTAQRLARTYRHHLGATARDAGREWQPPAEASADFLAEQIVASLTSPSQALARAERSARLRAALESMASADREILVLRHFEQLSNSESAAVLGLTVSAASHRYARALLKLKSILLSVFGGSAEMRG